MVDTQKQHILIVADDHDQSDLFTLVLERAGYCITAVSTAAEALTQLESSNYDLLLTDYMLPDINGDVLIDHLRARGNQIKAILMSNHVDVVQIARASKANAFFRKDDIFFLVKLVAEQLTKAAVGDDPASSRT